MTTVRRALAGLAVAGLAAAGTVLAAPTAQAAVPIGCSEPQRISTKVGWLTTDDDGTVRADPVEVTDPKVVSQQFRLCTPPDWQRPEFVLRSEATERYLLPSTLTGRVRAISQSPSAANIIQINVLNGGTPEGPFIIEVPSVSAFYDAREDLPGTPLYATATSRDAEYVWFYPVP